jgi:hypothetical protein
MRARHAGDTSSNSGAPSRASAGCSGIRYTSRSTAERSITASVTSTNSATTRCP